MEETLISIIVVSYNAEKTVLDTLDSVLTQTYRNIELVISDDCSKDNTVSVIEGWMAAHKNDISGGIKLLTIQKNTGVCANLNRAVLASTGEWIKIIAADDKLLPNCCTDYMMFVQNNQHVRIATSYQIVYRDTFEDHNLLSRRSAYRRLGIFDKTAEQQLKLMAYQEFVMAPTVFFSRSLYDDVGGFDECYAYEDHPFYVKILEQGTKIYFMPSNTVAYRLHQSSCNSSTQIFNYKFEQLTKQFRKEKCYKYFGFRQKITMKCYYILINVFETLHLNKRTPLLSASFIFFRNSLWKIGRPIV